MWVDSAVIESIPGKVSGVPLVKGTRLPVSTIVDNFNARMTVAEISEAFDVPEETVRAVLSAAKGPRAPGSV